MGFPSVLVLSLGLAMDATAVSAARGLAVPQVRLRHAVLVALFFGGFQAGMPLLGWALGATVGRFVEAWDHWIAFALLGAIGGKMVHEAWTKNAEDDDEPRDERALFGLRVMLLLAVATSIDAFAVGITLPMLRAPLLPTIATIGVTTALCSVLGLALGRRLGSVFGKRLDLVGGLALIGLGAKILIEHLTA